MTSWARSRPLLAFLVLTFLITLGTWWPMAAYTRGWTDLHVSALYFIGRLGPGLAAYVLMGDLYGAAGVVAAYLLGVASLLCGLRPRLATACTMQRPGTEGVPA